MFGRNLWTRAPEGTPPAPDALSAPQLVALLVQPAVDRLTSAVIPALMLSCLVIGLIAGLIGGLLAAALS